MWSGRPVDASIVEPLHFAMEAGREGEERQRERRAAGLAQSEPKIEQRFQAQLPQHEVVRRLCRA